MAPYMSSSVIQVSRNLKTPNWFEKMLFTPFKAEIFTVAAELKALACTTFEVRARAPRHVEGTNIVGASRDLD